MKGCLKSPSPSPSPGLYCSHSRKCVAFGPEGTEQVYTADEWDRTPMEPARKLSYQDMLELKEIQRSLPLADQLPDPVSGKPASRFLSTVPIGLLPLLPDSDSCGSPCPSSPASTPQSSSPMIHAHPPPTFSRPTPPTVQRQPAHLSHLLPGRLAPVRQKPRFAFVPLLDTPPPPSDYPSTHLTRSMSRSPSPEHHFDTDLSQDPPTPSLTNASLDSSPLSRASSCSPEPSFFQLPPLRKHENGIIGSYSPTTSDDGLADLHGGNVLSDLHHGVASMRIHSLPTLPLLPPSRFSLNKDQRDLYKNDPINTHMNRSCDLNSNRQIPIQKPPRRRNIIVVNDMEIELDVDDDEPATPPSSPVSPPVPTESLAPTSDPICIPQLNSMPHSPLQGDKERDPLSTPSTSPRSSSRASTQPGDPGSLHAPIRFKRASRGEPQPGVSSCSPKCGSVLQRSSPRSSPVLFPIA